MKAYLLVEGKSDQSFFHRILPDEVLAETILVAAGGRSDIASVARSLMVSKGRPLALVADADAVEAEAVELRRAMLDQLLRPVSAGIPYKIVLAEPSIESWILEVPGILDRVLGGEPPAIQREHALLRPRDVLGQLFQAPAASVMDRLIGALTESEIKILRETQPRKDLLEFLRVQTSRKSVPQRA